MKIPVYRSRAISQQIRPGSPLRGTVRMNPQAMAQLKSILTEREALYAQADATLDTSGQLLDSSLDKVIAIIEQQGFLR